MSKKPESDDDITNALEKLDLEAARLQGEKALKKRSKKPAPLKKKTERQEIIKKQNDEKTNEMFDSYKRNAFFLLIIFAVFLRISFRSTQLERANLVENVVIAFLVIGLMLSKANRS